MGAAPLALPRVRRAEASASRARAAPRAALDCPGIGGRLSVDAAGAGRCGPAPMRVALTWGGRSLSVRCPHGLLAATLRTLGTGLDPDRLPPDLAALLLEASLLPGLAALEDATGEDIRLTAVEADAGAAADPGWRLLFHDGERPWGLSVAFGDGEPAGPDDVLRFWPEEPRPMGEVPFPAALRLGTTVLTVGQLRSLRPDDAVLLETERRGGGMLVVMEAWLAQASRGEDGWRLDAVPRPARSRRCGGWIMGDGGDGMQDDDALGDPDDLPVKLAFDVGRLDVTLRELRRLDAGTVLDLGRPPEDLVRISANGRLVGQGMLVDVEGQVGVQIVRMFDHG